MKFIRTNVIKKVINIIESNVEYYDRRNVSIIYKICHQSQQNFYHLTRFIILPAISTDPKFSIICGN